MRVSRAGAPATSSASSRCGEGTAGAQAAIVASRVAVHLGSGPAGRTTASGAPVLLVATTTPHARDIAAALVGSRPSVTARSV